MPVLAHDDDPPARGDAPGASEEPPNDIGETSDVPVPAQDETDDVPLVAQGDYDDEAFIDAADLDNRKWRWEPRKSGKHGQNTYWLARTGRWYSAGHDTRETIYIGRDQTDPQERARSHGVDVGRVG